MALFQRLKNVLAPLPQVANSDTAPEPGQANAPSSKVVCFTPGTMIATRDGQKRIETIEPGDLVLTRDNGHHPVSWVGTHVLNQNDKACISKPIVIQANALGEEFPERDLCVSADHHMLIQSERAAQLFDEREVLVPAQYLTKLPGVSVASESATTYLHLLFDRHEIIMANGGWAESFLPGPDTMLGLKRAARDDVLALFPQLEQAKQVKNYDSARRLLKAYEAHMLTLDSEP